METSINMDEKKLLLKGYNHRLNNDLQALLAFIKLQKRFGVDKDEIINSSCVTIASISSIQNMIYKTEDSENKISIGESFEEFTKIINEYYSTSNIKFSYELKTDFLSNPKKVYHIIFLINEMINLSMDFSFNDESERKISWNIHKEGEECVLQYSDNGSGIKETISGSDYRAMLFGQLVKQIDGNLESSDDSNISIRFNQ